MTFETLDFEQDGPVGILTLNRPRCLNAVNAQMRDELATFWRRRAHDDATRVIVLTGAGRAFCSGLDMRDAALVGATAGGPPRAIYEAQRSFSELILLMRRCPQPIVAAIKGAAVGAGLAFATACDMRIVTPDARFQAAYINLGLGGADMGSSWLLPRAVGTGNAARYLLTGDFLGAEEAHRIGLAQAVVGQEELMTAATGLARQIASKSPLGLRVTKEALDANQGGPTLEQAILLEDRNQALCIAQLSARGSKR